MRFRDLLIELQGERTQTEFAACLGLPQPYVSMLLSNKRRPGRVVLEALVRAFPARKQDVFDSFFTAEYPNRDCNILNSVLVAASDSDEEAS